MHGEGMDQRAAALERLKNGPPGQILIIGGGINGVGVLRDLAAQRVPAMLIDKGDICSGTSAAPSRLIHGGLRYLETGEFGLVRESVEERDLLLLNAPHLVRPIKVWVPAASWTGGTLKAVLRFFRLFRDPGPKGALVLKLGLMIFDGFSRARRSMPRHRLIGQARARRSIPRLAHDVKLVAEYFDARIVHPERLTIELAADAEKDCAGSVAVPYVSLCGIDGDSVLLRDEISGESLRYSASLVVNCAGAWADRVNQFIGIDQPLIGGTRGSHLVLARPDLAKELGDVMLYFEASDHRACLVYALNKSNVLLGTTDIRSDDPDDRKCTSEEIDYLCGVIERVMPGAHVTPEDIALAYSGVRPLPKTDKGSNGAISRGHAIHVFEPEPSRPIPVITLVGGKWTTYRACAAQIVDLILERLGHKRIVDTAGLKIGGGQGFPENMSLLEQQARSYSERCRLPVQRMTGLLERYGSNAPVIAAFLGENGDTPIAGAENYSSQEIEWLVRHERVTRLEDVILRRTLIAFEHLAFKGTIVEIGTICGSVLDWSPAKVSEEIDRTMALLSGRYLVPTE